MDFLNKLYGNENFGIILFVVVSILVLAFLIVLFFGKKDQKVRKLAEEETNQNNNNNIENNIISNNIEEPKSENLFQEMNSQVTLEVPVNPVQNIQEPLETIAPINTPNLVLNENLVQEEPKEEIVYEDLTNMVPNPNGIPNEQIRNEFDFDALANSISKELENIGNTETESISKVEVEEPKLKTKSIAAEALNTLVENTNYQEFQKEEKNINPIVFETPNQVEHQIEEPQPMERRPIIEEKPKMPNPTQFSSVFVNKKAEDVPVKEEIQTEEVNKNSNIPESIPVKPTFELPKTIVLPKLNADPTPKVAPVIEETEPSVIFPGLENQETAYPKNDENRM